MKIKLRKKPKLINPALCDEDIELQLESLNKTPEKKSSNQNLNSCKIILSYREAFQQHAEDQHFARSGKKLCN